MQPLYRPFRRVAVVNRGEAAVRFLRGARTWSIHHKEPLEVGVFCTQADRGNSFISQADFAVDLGEAAPRGPDGTPRSAYLDIPRIVALLGQHGCDAVWPGWGFLSENADFADACAAAGVVFLGPSAQSMRMLGDKIAAKLLAEEHGVPVSPWSRGPAQSGAEALAHAQRIGFPVLLKAAAGGGGRGIRVVHRSEDVLRAFDSATAEARSAFGDGTVLVEAFVPAARHIEVQVLADCHGAVHALSTRDCSMQRRHQKVIEEAPALLGPGLHHTLTTAAVAMARACGYVSAGTAEFLVSEDGGTCYFLEMNTRLQVEHTITECVMDVDLVGAQISVARGEHLPVRFGKSRGHAVQARLNAEDPGDNFTPSVGRLLHFQLPHGPGLRVDAGFQQGDTVPSEYDSMLAKVIATGATREEAIARLTAALARMTVAIEGGASNRGLLLELLANQDYLTGGITTRWLDRYLASRDRALSRPHLKAALVAAAVGEYERAQQDEVARFLEGTRRGMPAKLPAAQPREYRYLAQGTQVALEVCAVGPARYRVAEGGLAVEVRVEHTGQGTAALYYKGQRLQVVHVVTPTVVHVEVGGVAHRFERACDGPVTAAVPGAVTRVLVAPGDLVQAGDHLVTLEIMKMEVAVKAPIAGRVSRIYVDAASKVAVGDRLAHIETVGEADAAPRALGDAPSAPSLWAGDADAVPARDAGDPVALLLGVILGYDATDRALEQAIAALRRDQQEGPEPLDGLCRLLEAALAQAELLDETPGADGVAAADHLLGFLRDAPGRRGTAAGPDDFRRRLLRALACHGITSLEDGPAVLGTLFRVVGAHRRRDRREACLEAALGALMRVQEAPTGAAARTRVYELLEDLSALIVRESPALAGLALSALYQLRDRRELQRAAVPLLQQAEEALECLAAPPETADQAGGRARALALLDEVPTSVLFALVSEWLSRPDEPHLLLLDTLIARLYPGARRVHGLDPTAALYQTGERSGVLGLLCRSFRLKREGRRAIAALPGSAAGWDLVIEAFVPVPQQHFVSRVERQGAAVLDAAGLPASVRRCSCGWGSLPSGRGSRTFERGPTGFTESTAARDLNPARVAAYQARLLAEFDIERVQSPADLFLARARARTDQRDTRLICILEVERFDAEHDQRTGRLLRAPGLRHQLQQAAHAMRGAQQRGPRHQWNRILIFLRPAVSVPRQELLELALQLLPFTVGLDLERLVIYTRERGADGLVPLVVECADTPGLGRSARIYEGEPQPVKPLSPLERRLVEARRYGQLCPYELIRALTADPAGPGALGLPPGHFVELELGEAGDLAPVSRPYGQNQANVVVGLISHRLPPFQGDDGLRRVLLMGDPTRSMGALAEPECRRILAAFDLAQRLGLPVEWVPVSSGARIAMDSGTENLDFTALVLARIVRFTQAGGVVNLIVDGLCIGAQSYWNAEATMLMHCRGALIMTESGSMLLTGKKALEFSGAVAAEDNLGIGGYRRIMGPSGQAQYFAKDLLSAYQVLLRHYQLTHVPPGEARPRELPSADPAQRDIRAAPYPEGEGFATVGDIFDEEVNPGRKRPFAIRPVLRAVLDADIEALERWAGWQGAESAVVLHGSLGGQPVCCIGIESRPVARRGEVPIDGPESWSAGTLFPLSSKKVARALNAASGVQPVVVLANLSGFDGSPESMRHLQLEYGAEIGRAIVNFQGPLVLCVVARYHGGAYVVFSRALSPHLQAVALRGSYASVIGGGAAAAVVFPGLVRKRAAQDERVQAAQALLTQAAAAPAGSAQQVEQIELLEEGLAAAQRAALADAQGAVAREFDAIHSVDRALRVGSLEAVIDAHELRPRLIGLLRQGLLAHQAPPDSAGGRPQPPG